MDLVLKLPKRRKVPKRIKDKWAKDQSRKAAQQLARPPKRIDYAAQWAERMASRAKWTAFYARKRKGKAPL